MSAIDALIGPSARGPDAPSRCVRTLLVGSDVRVHLREDASSAEVAMYSVVLAASLHVLQRAGVAGTYRHAAHPQARWLIRLDTLNQRLLLAQIWPQAALDAVTFGQQLAEQARRHRRWARLSGEEPPASPGNGTESRS